MFQFGDKIKAILFDIDGVLTDGSITLDANGEEIKSFHVRDGQLIRFMQEKGILFGTISGRQSIAAETRMKALKIDFVRLGQDDKLEAYAAFKQEFKLKDENIVYLGDDVIDIPIFKEVGLAIAPADASPFVVPHVKYLTRKPGGKGVLREVIDALILERGWNIWGENRPGIGFKR